MPDRHLWEEWYGKRERKGDIHITIHPPTARTQQWRKGKKRQLNTNRIGTHGWYITCSIDTTPSADTGVSRLWRSKRTLSIRTLRPAILKSPSSARDVIWQPKCVCAGWFKGFWLFRNPLHDVTPTTEFRTTCLHHELESASGLWNYSWVQLQTKNSIIKSWSGSCFGSCLSFFFS